MFDVEKAPAYVAETAAAVARLQEMAPAGRYAALVERAERLLEGMFTVETNVDPGLCVRIAIRERFVAARVKQAILMVATWRLIRELADGWSVGKPRAAVSRPAPAAVLV